MLSSFTSQKSPEGGACLSCFRFLSEAEIFFFFFPSDLLSSFTSQKSPEGGACLSCFRFFSEAVFVSSGSVGFLACFLSRLEENMSSIAFVALSASSSESYKDDKEYKDKNSNDVMKCPYH